MIFSANHPPNLRLLQLGLLIASIGWGISFFFTFAPWSVAMEQLRSMGAPPTRYLPLLDYWLRMASATFGCVGISALVCLFRPREHAGLVRMLGWFHLFLACVLGSAVLRNGMNTRDQPTFPADITFCLLVAGLVLVSGWKGEWSRGRG